MSTALGRVIWSGEKMKRESLTQDGDRIKRLEGWQAYWQSGSTGEGDTDRQKETKKGEFSSLKNEF